MDEKYKIPAEQQVREMLGWEITGKSRCFEHYEERHAIDATQYEIAAYNLAVSKTAELLEMTALLQKIADTIGKLPSITGLSPVSRFEDIPLAIRDLQENYLDASTARNFGVSHAKVSKQLAEMTAQRDEAQKALEIAKQRIAELEENEGGRYRKCFYNTLEGL